MRERVYQQLHGVDPAGLTLTQRVVLLAILVGVGIAILDTEPELPDGVHEALRIAEVFVAAVFSVEYVLRVWSVGVEPRFAGVVGRLKYMVRPLVIVDLLALLPFLLGVLGGESLVLRSLRVLRLLALSKLVRYSEAMRIVIGSIVERRFELLFAVMIAALMILVSATALYLIEGTAQPKAFGSIVRAMWWSVVTLTTVGYGDVFPLTPLGKAFAAVTAIAGIGMIAMPTGILAAAFADGFARARERAGRTED